MATKEMEVVIAVSEDFPNKWSVITSHVIEAIAHHLNQNMGEMTDDISELKIHVITKVG